MHNWGKHDPPTQIQTRSYKHNINHNNANTQTQQHKNRPNIVFTRELSEQIQEFPISKQRITIQHQIHHTHEQETIKPHHRNLFIPQTAIHPFLNNTTHNKTHRRSRRVFDKNLSQNNNSITTGPQDIFIEHYDYEINEISNVKYYELNKISTCNFKPMDLEMEKTVVQPLLRAKAIEIEAFAIEGTIRESVQRCSQHIDYIRASRQSYFFSDAQRTKVLDLDEVRNELARIQILKNTKYQPKNYNISFNFMNNPSLQNRLEKEQVEIRFPYNTPLTPPYGRLVYDHSGESWVPIASSNKQSNGGRKVQSRLPIIDWTLALSILSLTLNLETNEISLDGTKLPSNVEKTYCHPTAFTKAAIVWEPKVRCQIFEMIRFDA